MAAAAMVIILPMSVMAAKGTFVRSLGEIAGFKASESDLKETETAEESEATASDLSAGAATASDLDDHSILDLKPGEVPLVNDMKPVQETQPVPETLPLETPPATTAAVDKDAPTGTWSVDGVTTYQFDEDGTGTLILPGHAYTFTYEAEGGELRLEFEDDRVEDAVFRYEQSGDTLNLDRVLDEGIMEVTLDKQ